VVTKKRKNNLRVNEMVLRIQPDRLDNRGEDKRAFLENLIRLLDGVRLVPARIMQQRFFVYLLEQPSCGVEEILINLHYANLLPPDFLIPFRVYNYFHNYSRMTADGRLEIGRHSSRKFISEGDGGLVRRKNNLVERMSALRMLDKSRHYLPGTVRDTLQRQGKVRNRLAADVITRACHEAVREHARDGLSTVFNRSLFDSSAEFEPVSENTFMIRSGIKIRLGDDRI
jgi:hypothetical protein